MPSTALRTHLATVSTGGLTDSRHRHGAAIGTDYLAAVIAGTDRTTLVTVALVIVILLLIYRAPVAAMVPLLTIGAAFVVARAVLALLADGRLADPLAARLLQSSCSSSASAPTTPSSCSRAIARSWDGRHARRAAAVTVGRIGAVITASAATVMVGL